MPVQYSRHRAFYSKQFSQPWRRFQSSFRGEIFLTAVRLQNATVVLFGVETSVTMSSSGMLLLLSALLLHSARHGSAGKVTSRLWRRDQNAGRTTLKEHSYKWIVLSSLYTSYGVWTDQFFVFYCLNFLFFALTDNSTEKTNDTSRQSDNCESCGGEQTDSDSVKGIKSCDWFILCHTC